MYTGHWLIEERDINCNEGLSNFFLVVSSIYYINSIYDDNKEDLINKTNRYISKPRTVVKHGSFVSHRIKHFQVCLFLVLSDLNSKREFSPGNNSDYSSSFYPVNTIFVLFVYLSWVWVTKNRTRQSIIFIDINI